MEISCCIDVRCISVFTFPIPAVALENPVTNGEFEATCAHLQYTISLQLCCVRCLFTLYECIIYCDRTTTYALTCAWQVQGKYCVRKFVGLPCQIFRMLHSLLLVHSCLVAFFSFRTQRSCTCHAYVITQECGTHMKECYVGRQVAVEVTPQASHFVLCECTE